MEDIQFREIRDFALETLGVLKLNKRCKLNDLETFRLVDKKKLREIVPYSPSHIYRLEKAGKFPSRISLGPARVAYRLAEIEEWVECKAEGREWKPASSSDGGADG